ncbi:MAG: glycosyl hydrolase [Candidatus Latescibacterota bacterium]
MPTMREEFASTHPPRSMTPLFWVHGEEERLLREEIAKMDEGGMRGFIVESRVHPDYLGSRWWHDLEIIVDEAKARGMEVWILDDKRFPSGYAAGIPARENPAFAKLYLAERHIDTYGPVPYACFDIGAWLDEGEWLVAAVAARRSGPGTIAGDSLVDLTDLVGDGYLRYEVPEGEWRLFLMVATRTGGEEGTKEYINPLVPEAVDRYIEVVFEATCEKLGHEFGHTLKGFFTDEPRFGNAASYDSLPGQPDQVLPYYDGFLPDFCTRTGYEMRRLLPLLWYEGGADTGKVRYDYMDAITTRFADTFFRRIGNWCRDHGVRWIGHIVEDNGAHGRLGYGGGHYFRDMAHLDMGGVDVVYQVWPGVTDGMMNSPFSHLNMDFFYWGLVKLASSAAHLDPRKHGMTLCEAYGAYGWREGLRLMKWLTDYLCVRGVNRIVPHAFSPRFPDPDCPPHFWARGHNPQWPYFRYFANYANRTCYLLSGGMHVAEAVVLYTASSLWAAGGDDFEKTVRVLAEAQIDCDVVPYDSLSGAGVQVENGRLFLGTESFRTVILPRVEALPAAALSRLAELSEAGIPVLILERWPERPCSGDDNMFRETLERLKAAAILCNYSELGGHLRQIGLRDFLPDADVPFLRHLHYRKEGRDLYFLFNEDLHRAVDTWVTVETTGIPELWDPLTGKQEIATSQALPDHTRVQVRLAPFESIFVVFGNEAEKEAAIPGQFPEEAEEFIIEVTGPWKTSRVTAEKCPGFTSEPALARLGDWSLCKSLARFAGTVRYETTFRLPENGQQAQEMVLDLGEVFELVRVAVNGGEVGLRIAPPYRFPVTGLLRPGENRLTMDVTNTLVRSSPTPEPFSRYAALEPCGLLGPVRLILRRIGG